MDLTSFLMGRITGGPSVVVEPLSVTENRVYTAEEGKAYSPVDVDVPNTYVESDEGKVVSDGALISQTPHGLITENGAYDTTNNNSVSINVTVGKDYTGIFERTEKNVELPFSTLGEYVFYNYKSMETFTDINLVTIGDYAFASCGNLTTVNCPNVENIGVGAFSGCSKLKTIGKDLGAIDTFNSSVFQNCQAFSDVSTITAGNIGENALRSFSALSNTSFSYKPSVGAKIGKYAFSNSSIIEIDGELEDVGEGAFSSCSYLTKIHANLSGTVERAAFLGSSKVYDVDLSNSTVESLAQEAFNNLGKNRQNAQSNSITIDLSKGFFEFVNPYTFGNLINTIVILPETVTTIAANAFVNSSGNVVYVSGIAPTLSASNSFGGTYKVFVPWKYASSYYTGTNWSAITNNIYAYAASNTFTVGESLPEYDCLGCSLTWYSDQGKTTQVTTCPDGSPELYCVPSSTRSKMIVKFNKYGTSDPQIVVLDSNSNPVDISNGFIACDQGDIFNISVYQSADSDSYIEINSQKITEFPHTITVADSDIIVCCVCWNHSVINDDFDSANWFEIKNAIDSGVAQTLYSDCVGKKKLAHDVNNRAFTVTLVNATDNLYEKASSGTTGFVFMFKSPPSMCVQSIYDSRYSFSGGWPESYMRNTSMAIIYNGMSAEMRAVMEPVRVYTRDSASDSLVSSNDAIFIPAEKEINPTAS